MSDVTWRKTKDPGEKLDYIFDFNAPEAEGGPWLDTGDTISSRTVVDATGVLLITNVAHTTTKVTARIAGGVLGTTYLVVVHVVTVSGQEPERTLSLRIVSK